MAPVRLLSRAVACLLLATAALGVAADEANAIRVTSRGSLPLPMSARDAAGAEVELTGLSGITWLGDDRYASVMDNSHWLVLLRLTLADDGAPEAVSDIVVRRLGERHDYEDVAPCPEALVRRIAARRERQGMSGPGTCLLLCEEDTPAIRAVALDTGELLGIVPIPEPLRSPRPNRGLESLAVDMPRGEIWTANEEALAADGPAATEGAGTVVRLSRITVPGAEGVAPAAAVFAYLVDPPHTFARVIRGDPLSGISALVSLGGGRLLVLERSGGPGVPPFENRIYLVDAARGTDVSATARDLAAATVPRLEKQLLWRDSLGCNVEGLCLGPAGADGTRTLVAVTDNGGLPGPSQILTFGLAAPAGTATAPTSP